MTSIKMKIELGDDCRRVALEPVTYARLQSLCKELYPTQLTGSFQIKYRDDDNEYITIQSDDELADAFGVAKELGQMLLKVSIVPEGSRLVSTVLSQSPALSRMSSFASLMSVREQVPAAAATPLMASPAAAAPAASTAPAAPVAPAMTTLKVEVPVVESTPQLQAPTPKVEESVATPMVSEPGPEAAAAAAAAATTASVPLHPLATMLASMAASPHVAARLAVMAANPLMVAHLAAKLSALAANPNAEQFVASLVAVPAVAALLRGLAGNPAIAALLTSAAADPNVAVLLASLAANEAVPDHVAALASAAVQAAFAHLHDDVPVAMAAAAKAKATPPPLQDADDAATATDAATTAAQPAVSGRADLASATEAAAAATEEQEAAAFAHVVHAGVRCDGCGALPLRGLRYKCHACPDFDLCHACHVEHPHAFEHFFVVLKSPSVPVEVATPTPTMQADVHATITCDGCGQNPLVGARYQCTVCYNFDLCAACEAQGRHDPAHPLLKRRVASAGPVPPMGGGWMGRGGFGGGSAGGWGHRGHHGHGHHDHGHHGRHYGHGHGHHHRGGHGGFGGGGHGIWGQVMSALGAGSLEPTAAEQVDLTLRPATDAQSGRLDVKIQHKQEKMDAKIQHAQEKMARKAEWHAARLARMMAQRGDFARQAPAVASAPVTPVPATQEAETETPLAVPAVVPTVVSAEVPVVVVAPAPVPMAAAAAEAPHAAKVAVVVGMGFPADRAQAALAATDGQVGQAVELLLSQA